MLKEPRSSGQPAGFCLLGRETAQKKQIMMNIFSIAGFQFHNALDNFSRCASFLEIPDHQSKLETLIENHPFTAADIPVPAPIMQLYRLLVNRSLE